MANWTDDVLTWVPRYIAQVLADPTGKTIASERWNELWNLNIAQGDDVANLLVALIDALNTTVMGSTDGAASITFDDASLDATNVKAAILEVATEALANLNAHKASGDHDTRYYTEAEVDAKDTAITNALSTHKTSTDHDGRYYTEAEVDAKDTALAAATTNLAGAGRTTETVRQNAVNMTTHKTSADHDGRYYTETEINTIINNLVIGQIGPIPDAWLSDDVGAIKDRVATNTQDISDLSDAVGAIDISGIATNADAIEDLADAITPDSVVSQVVTITTASPNKKLTLYIGTEITGGAVTIVRNGATAKPLVDIEEVAVTAVAKGYCEVYEEATFFVYAPSGGGSNIKSVQRGSTLINTASVTASVTINEIDLSKSAITNFSVRLSTASSDTSGNLCAYGFFNNSTTLVLYRPSGNNPIYVDWEITEFIKVKSKQDKTVGLSATVSNIDTAITSVDLSKTIILPRGVYANTLISDPYNSSFVVSMSLTSSTNLKTIRMFPATSSMPSLSAYTTVIEFY